MLDQNMCFKKMSRDHEPIYPVILPESGLSTSYLEYEMKLDAGIMKAFKSCVLPKYSEFLIMSLACHL